MKNKSLLLKFGAMVFAIFCFSLSSVSATLFHLNVDDMSALNEAELKKSILPIHFADNGNDFGGFFYFSNGLGNYTGTDNVSDYMYEVEVGTSRGESEYYKCSRQVRGFYYNAERGERLWPLDQETWSGVNSIKSLKTEGGLYTRCEDPRYLDALSDCEAEAILPGATRTYQQCKDEVRGNYKSDGNGYYGDVVQTYPKDSNQKFSFAAGVDYNTGTKFVTISGNSKLVPTFARLENKYPVGFIYDHNGGVGLVGCKINNLGADSVKRILNNLKSPDYLADLFYYDESERKIKYSKTDVDVDCSELIWDQLLGLVIEGIVGLGEDENRNNLDIILNEKDKKMQYFSTAKINNKTLINYAKKKSAILCRGNSNTDDVICGTSIGLSSPTQRKTYIITNGNAVIRPLTESQLNAGYYYDVFVMNGDLIIDERSTNDKFKFNTGGFVGSKVSSNYVVEEPAIASLIKGNFIVNGNIKGTGTGGKLYDKYFIYGKLTTTDNFNTLLDTFQWRCNNGVSTTESNGAVRPCPSEMGGWENPYAGASLVVIDQNYDSAFYNS